MRPSGWSVRSLFTTAVLTALVGVQPAYAALRSPQVPVSGTALQSFFTAHGQAINVNTDQQDVQQVGFPAVCSFDTHLFGGLGISFGAYNAGAAVPSLYQVLPGASSPGWFASVGFRDSPARLHVDLFDNTSAFLGTNTYLGADHTGIGFYDVDAGGTFYSQDARNAGGAPRILAYSGTGADAGSTWFACETGAGPGGDFTDLVVLLGFPTGPVPTSTTTWSRVKALYH